MRDRLATLRGQRFFVQALVGRFGTMPAQVGTVLLLDIRDLTQRPVMDHAWFLLRDGFGALGLRVGARVEFEARATAYVKGFQPDERFLSRVRGKGFQPVIVNDYKLAYPRCLRKLEAEAPARMVS